MARVCGAHGTLVIQTNLDKEFGISRIIDTPVSESACTGAAGASIVGMRPIIVHPRMDFMLYAMDSIVNRGQMVFYVWRTVSSFSHY